MYRINFITGNLNAVVDTVERDKDVLLCTSESISRETATDYFLYGVVQSVNFDIAGNVALTIPLSKVASITNVESNEL